MKNIGHINLYLDPTLAKLLRLLAANEGLSVTKFVEQIVKAYIASLNEKGETA